MLPNEIVANLQNPKAWFSLAVRHELPHLDRLWLRSNDSKLCLHRLYPLPVGSKPYFHKHPWACETRLLRGSYWMNVGYGRERPPVAVRLRLTPGSVFVMDNPDSWHTVEPEEIVYTVFQITNKWDNKREEIYRMKHSRLPMGVVEQMLEEFSSICEAKSVC